MNVSNLKSDLNKHLFVVLLIVGVALSCIVRIFFEYTFGTGGTSIIAIVICLVFLFMYAYTVWRDNTGLHNPENLYYMGLLFTLASLVYSLVTLFWLTSNDSDIAERTYNLIGSFGIALISTFFGILFRILLLQKLDLDNTSLSNEPGESGRLVPRGQDVFDPQKQSVPVDLNDAAFKLRMELTQTIADMRVFRGAIIQATNETVQESDKARAAMIQQIEEAANEQTRILSTLSTTTVDKLTITLDGVTTSVENVQKSLDDLADKQVQRARLSIDMAEKSTRELENGMQNSLRQIDQSAAEIATTFNTMLTPLQSIMGDLQSTSDNTQNIFNQYASLNSALQQSLTFFTNIESQIAQSVNALTVSTEAFSGSLAEATKVTPQYTQQFEQLIMILRQEAEQWQSMTQEVRSSLAQAIDELTQLVKRS